MKNKNIFSLIAADTETLSHEDIQLILQIVEDKDCDVYAFATDQEELKNIMQMDNTWILGYSLTCDDDRECYGETIHLEDIVSISKSNGKLYISSGEPYEA